MLSTVLRGVVTASAVSVAFAAHRSLFRGSRLAPRAGVLFLTVGALAALFTFVPALRPSVVIIFPIGLFFGLLVAVGSLALPSVRDAFDRMKDGDIRMLVGSRIAFGAMLLGLAAASAIP